MKFCSCQDRDSSRLGNSVVVETETHQDWEILWLSRPRLIETGKFCGCRERDSSRLGNFVVVETETKQDWEFLWLSRLRPVETEQKLSRPRLHQESCLSLIDQTRLRVKGHGQGTRDSEHRLEGDTGIMIDPRSAARRGNIKHILF